MAKIIGNTTATPNPRPDWNQTDETKADFIKNKPDIGGGVGTNSIQQTNTGAGAYGNNAAAFNRAIAGCKGFRYKAIDRYNRYIYLTDEEVEWQENGDTILTGKDVVYNVENLDLTDYYKSDADFIGKAKGDVFTLKTRAYDFDLCGRIVSINGNRIQYDSGVDSHIANFITYIRTKEYSAAKHPTYDPNNDDDMFRLGMNINDTYVDRYSFSVPRKPEQGEVIVSEDSFAMGTERTMKTDTDKDLVIDETGTIASGRFSVSMGRSNLAFGDSSTAFGRDNIAGYGSFVAGQSSKGMGDRNFTLGYSCRNEGGQSFLTGNSNSVERDANYATVGGYGNHANTIGGTVFGRLNGTTKAKDQTIVGHAADPKNSALFIVGNGVINETSKPISATSRSNAFLVWEDGRASVGAAPESPEDVANKDYVDVKFNEIIEESRKYIDDQLGDIEKGLDDIISMQESLIGGGVE